MPHLHGMSLIDLIKGKEIPISFTSTSPLRHRYILDTSILRTVRLVRNERNSYKLYICNTDTSILRTVRLVPETKIHIKPTSLIQTPLYYGQFAWFERDQTSYKVYLCNTDISIFYGQFACFEKKNENFIPVIHIPLYFP